MQVSESFITNSAANIIKCNLIIDASNAGCEAKAKARLKCCQHFAKTFLMMTCVVVVGSTYLPTYLTTTYRPR